MLDKILKNESQSTIIQFAVFVVSLIIIYNLSNYSRDIALIILFYINLGLWFIINKWHTQNYPVDREYPLPVISPSQNLSREQLVLRYFLSTPRKPTQPSQPKETETLKYIGVAVSFVSSLILLNTDFFILVSGIAILVISFFIWASRPGESEEDKGVQVIGCIGMLIGGAVIFGLVGIGELFNRYPTEIGGSGLIVAMILIYLNYIFYADELQSHAKKYQKKFIEYKEEFLKTEPKPSDSLMDKWLHQDLEEIKRDALQKLDINAEDIITPQGFNKHDSQAIVVVGPGPKADLAIGKDGVIRFSMYDILIVYLTKYHLAAYKCTLDLATRIRTQETTQEYAYKNIVSVSTKIGSNLAITFAGQTTSIPNYQQFALSVANGDTISVVTSLSADNQLLTFLKDGKLPDSGADKAIRAIRSQLRDKAMD